MSSKKTKIFSVIFFSLLAVHILLDNLNSFWSYFTKPALLGSLIVFFINESKHLQKRTRNVMLLALVFSLIGDLLLMFVDQSPHFFTAGLAAFLLAHISYIVLFFKVKKGTYRNRGIGVFLIIILYFNIILSLIHENLGELHIPVLIYMAAIMSMFIVVASRKGHVPKLSYTLVLVGAILFIISDSILALNKFYRPILFPQVSIMLSYGLAQFLITLGVLKQEH